MSRIRTIKPELWADETLGRLSRDARLLFIGIISNADDHGRFRAHAAALKSAILPYDVATLEEVDGWLAELATTTRVVLYTIDGQRYGWVKNWSKHQKVDHPCAPRFPEPPRALRPRAKSGSGSRRKEEPERVEKFARTRDGLARVSESLAPDQGSGIRDQGSGTGTGECEGGAPILASSASVPAGGAPPPRTPRPSRERRNRESERKRKIADLDSPEYLARMTEKIERLKRGEHL